MTIAPLSVTIIDTMVLSALAEDFGLVGDITSNAVVPQGGQASGVLVARRPGVLAGVAFARAVFHAVDPAVGFTAALEDGMPLRPGDAIASISGGARSLLAGERAALNFLTHLSGIASLTRQYVDASGGLATIVSTRKTLPGLRAAQTYAVRCGGGGNHRLGLFDAVLIKDNHIVAAGGIGAALSAARRSVGHMIKIEIEIDRPEQLDEIAPGQVDAVLLDNMSPAELAAAVARARGRLGAIVLEASGGVDLSTVGAIAASGVDIISVGALTHSAPALDIGLDFD